MGRKPFREDPQGIKDREMHKQKYRTNENLRKYMKIKYMMRVNNIQPEEIEDFEDIQDKLEYCQLVHIKNKYGITIADIDDATTVATVHE